MKTVTVSARLEADEALLLESIARMEGCDRSALIKTVLRRGLREIRLERALEAFRREKITLSRAAELAGLSQWDFLALTDKDQSNLHYDVGELEIDLPIPCSPVKRQESDVIVCDASPLIFLAKLDRLHLIADLLGTHVVVLRCVADEILSPSANPLEHRRIETFLATAEIVDFSESTYESLTLSASDRFTLTYAVRTKAAWLVADERLLRRVALQEGLRVVGFLGLLIQAAGTGLLSKQIVRQPIETAISDHHLHISLQLYRQLIGKLSEDPPP